MYKRGSHVGVVISFVIFITFLAFLYSITEPAIKTQKEVEYFSERLKTELVKEFLENMSAYTISIDEDFPINENKPCSKLEDLLDEIELGDHLLIIEPDGRVLDFDILSTEGHLQVTTINSTSKFLKIYDSVGLISNEVDFGTGCQNIQKNYYTMGLTSKDEYAFIGVINYTIESMENTAYYEDLKERLKIPADRNFGFSLMNSDKEILLKTNEGNISTNVYIDEFPIIYINETAGETFGFLRIKIW